MIYRDLVSLVFLVLLPDHFMTSLVEDRNQLPRRRHFLDIYGKKALIHYLSVFPLATESNDNYLTRPSNADGNRHSNRNSLVTVDRLTASDRDFFQPFDIGIYNELEDWRSMPFTSVTFGNDRNALNDGIETSPHQSNSFDKRGNRHKTAANIEILLVVDNSIFRKYLKANSYDAEVAKKKILEYFSIVFAMVNQRFDTVSDPDFSLNVHISGVFIAETRMEGSWLEPLVRWSQFARTGLVMASRALKRFQKWLKRTRGLPKFDHAVVFTRYTLTKKNKKVDGLAYVGTMCKIQGGKSASIVHDMGDFQSVGVIAHELGHSLGASHDGEGDNRACPADDNFIMAPQSSQDADRSKNVYYFSDCSIKQMSHLVTSRQGSCLRNSPTIHVNHDLQSNPPGELLNKDVQCKLAFGRNSKFCDESSVKPLICQRLWCTSPDTSQMCRTNSRLMALPGTTCGDRKSCHLGNCISTRSTLVGSAISQRTKPRKTTFCPAGDRSPPYCSVIVKTSPYLCERPHLNQYCCHSCAYRPAYK